MADKKKPPAQSGTDVLWQVIAVIFFMFFLSTSLARTDLPEKLKNFSYNTSDKNIEGEMSFIGALFPSGELDVDQKVSNKGTVHVRAEPGGQILGRQAVREVGKILAGPIDKFSKTWWRVDYENAPDGWVWDGNITNKTILFGIFNIAPIAYSMLKPFFIFISIILIVLIVVVMLKISDLNKVKRKKMEFVQEQEMIKSRGEVKVSEVQTSNNESQLTDIEIAGLPTGDDAPRTESPKNRRWSMIQSLINSHNVNDWKQAIIEADIILEEMLDKMGYKGDSIGDKLKKVEKSDFLTLDSAWEAHKIRNRIAHKGSNYVLSKDDAEKAIEMYREVFSEFYYI